VNAPKKATGGDVYEEAAAFAAALAPVEEKFVAEYGINRQLLQTAKDLLATLP